jgi:hypothetical protein
MNAAAAKLAANPAADEISVHILKYAVAEAEYIALP